MSVSSFVPDPECDCFSLAGTLAHDPACPNARAESSFVPDIDYERARRDREDGGYDDGPSFVPDRDAEAIMEKARRWGREAHMLPANDALWQNRTAELAAALVALVSRNEWAERRIAEQSKALDDALETLRQYDERLTDRTEALAMLRAAWNHHMDGCEQFKKMPDLPAPTLEDIRVWMDAPSATASAMPPADATGCTCGPRRYPGPVTHAPTCPSLTAVPLRREHPGPENPPDPRDDWPQA